MLTSRDTQAFLIVYLYAMKHACSDGSRASRLTMASRTQGTEVIKFCFDEQASYNMQLVSL